nr:hypothetical protein [Mycoplasmopsis bovis]
MVKPEEGSSNNGIGWGENHLWGKDDEKRNEYYEDEEDKVEEEKIW